MQLRCKCGYRKDYTIHKDGLEAVNFTCERCRTRKLQPRFITLLVGSTTLIIKRGRMVER